MEQSEKSVTYKKKGTETFWNAEAGYIGAKCGVPWTPSARPRLLAWPAAHGSQSCSDRALSIHTPLPGHKQQGDRGFSPAQHLSGTWPWLWASAALRQPLLPREDGTGHSRDCCLTVREEMWGFQPESQLGWGPRAAQTQANMGVGETQACREDKAGCWQCCPLFQSGLGGPQYPICKSETRKRHGALVMFRL